MAWSLFRMSAVALAATVCLVAAPAFAQAPPVAQAPSATAPPPYEVRGFRSAHFGMSPAEVRAAIAADLPGAQVAAFDNPAERTQILQVRLDHLDPAPGPVTVTYIFGATSKTLADVTVIWTLAGEPTDDQRGALVAAAVELRRYFEALPSLPKASVGATPIGPNALVLFGAVDSKGAAVELAIDGVAFQTGGKATAPPKGPAVLRISYIRNPTNPDVYKVRPGSF